jgi:AcrR family transcriptional regulator
MQKAKDALAGLRERKKLQTREAIVTAALDLFDRQGYDATTVEEIAAAADVSPRTFFRYFDSKAELVMEPKEEREGFAVRLASRPADEGPIEALRQVLHQELLAYLSDGPIGVRKMRCMLGTASLQATARDHFNEHQAELAEEFARRLDRSPDDLAPQVMAAAVGNVVWTVATRWVAEDSPPERLVAMIDEALDLLAEGLA